MGVNIIVESLYELKFGKLYYKNDKRHKNQFIIFL